MIAFFLAPIYILINVYIIRWLLKWMGAVNNCLKTWRVRAVTVLVYCFFSGAMLAAFYVPQGKLQRFLKVTGNYWLGVFLYTILLVLLADILRLFLQHTKMLDQEKLRSRRTFVVGGGICILLVVGVSLYGAVNARRIRTTEYQVTVDKQVEGLDSIKVVLTADLHLGYNIGCRQMEKMVDKINQENPDLVVIAGDIFDNQYEALDDPERLISILKEMKSRYGVYACYGNHDIEEPILAGFTFEGKNDRKESDPRMDELLEKANIRLLRDETVLIDEKFYLCGRADYAKPGRGIEVRKTPEELMEGLDQTKPILVMDHEPREFSALSQAGADLDLCGHTHDGQLFPGNILVDLMWENAYGYKKSERLHTIVTSGVGLFGPFMRVGTKSEICPVTVYFAGQRGLTD